MELVLKPDLVICLICNSTLEDVIKVDVEGAVSPYVARSRIILNIVLTVKILLGRDAFRIYKEIF